MSTPSGNVRARAESKAMRRLMPMLLLMYVMAYLDRANVGFAEQSWRADTGLSEKVFAFGAGVFFLGYAFLEVPSNLLLHRFGARRWLARIMISWGLVSAAMFFAHSAETFYALRFLLGITEAGFFPGVIFYISQWFSGPARSRALACFYLGAPLALVLGSPLSGALLGPEGVAGLRGWQWMFLVEGLGAVAVGLLAARWLVDGPQQARWLHTDEREALMHAQAAPTEPGWRALIGALIRPRTLYLGGLYALIQIAVYGVTFYLPSQLANLFGARMGLFVGMVGALPWLAAAAAVLWLPGLAQRSQRHAACAGAAMGLAGIGIALSAMPSPLIGLFGLCLGAAGFMGASPVFWLLASQTESGRSGAATLALINTFGAIGGFLAPNLRHLAQTTGWQGAGLLVPASAALLAAWLLWRLRSTRASNALPICSTPQE